MAEKTLKGADELHIGVEVFFIKDKHAYHADGRPVELDKARVCQHCTQSPPFVATERKDKFGRIMSAEMVFAKHMVEKHPEYAKPKPLDRRPKAALSTEGEDARLQAMADEHAVKKSAKKTTKKAKKK